MLTQSNLRNVIKLRPIELDDIASIRYIHKTAFEVLAGDKHSEDEVRAHTDLVYSQGYVDKIVSSNMLCAIIDDQIVGTSGWCPADDNGRTARIKQVFVHPLFHTIGIGRLLVANAEKRALQAGFDCFSAQANINAVPFYKRLDYTISSYGTMSTLTQIDLPVAFMRKSLEQEPKMVTRRKTQPANEEFAFA